MLHDSQYLEKFPYFHINLNDLSRLKLCSISMNFIKKIHCWILRRSEIILSESQLCLHIIWGPTIKWLNLALSKSPLFALLQAPNLKRYIFWSGNVTEIVKKIIKNWSLGKKRNFKDFLKTTRKNYQVNFW